MHHLHPSNIHGRQRTPLVKIAVAWLVALAFVVGHHFFNTHLNGQVVTTSSASDFHWKNTTQLVHSQVGASAIGTTFAYLVTGFLGACVGTALVQCTWNVVRKHSFTVAGLDALWSSQTNAFAFLEADFWRGARGVVLVAAVAWAFPLIVTFAPGTLSVVNKVMTSNGTCNVPTVDFTASAAFYNTLNSASVPYSNPTPLANRVVGATLLGGQPFSPTSSPCLGNCSYVLTVNAPSFSCSPGAVDVSALNWDTEIVPSSHPPPYVGLSFDSLTPQFADYTAWDIQIHYEDYASSQGERFIPSTDGVNNNVTCVAYNSTYSINYAFFGSTPSVSISQIVLQEPASQLFQNSTDGSNPTFDGSDTLVHSGWFNATTNYYALFRSLYSSIEGNITVLETGSSISFDSTSSLSVTDTHLVSVIDETAGNITWSDMPGTLESLMQNITLSILTLASTIDASLTTATTCMSTTSLQYFSYSSHRLLLVYGLGLAVTLVCAFTGVAAVWSNEFGGTGGFSDILAATRNTELSDIDLKEPVKLKYGPLRSAGGRFAFGRPETLMDGSGKPSKTMTMESLETVEANRERLLA